MAIPRSIIAAILINGTLGFAMLIAVLFSLASLTSAEVQFIFPMLDIFYGVTNSIAGAAAMGSIILTLAICATMGLYVSTSRVFWSFARDHGLPFWRTLAKVCPVFIGEPIYSPDSFYRSILARLRLSGPLAPLPPLQSCCLLSTLAQMLL